MIILKTTKTDFLFKYTGNIEVYRLEPFLCISADHIIKDPDLLDGWETRVFDKFWLEDIEWIRGE